MKSSFKAKTLSGLSSFAAAALLQLVATSSANAALGGVPAAFTSSAQNTQTASARSSAVKQVVSPVLAASSGAASYSVTETTLATGTIVKEYLTSGGVVFAVSWVGPFLPDLRELLGQHFDTLTEEVSKTPRAGHTQVAVHRGALVVQASGHMRAFQGKALLTTLLPAGVTAADVQ